MCGRSLASGGPIFFRSCERNGGKKGTLKRDGSLLRISLDPYQTGTDCHCLGSGRKDPASTAAQPLDGLAACSAAPGMADHLISISGSGWFRRKSPGDGSSAAGFLPIPRLSGRRRRVRQTTAIPHRRPSLHPGIPKGPPLGGLSFPYFFRPNERNMAAGGQ